MSVEKGGLPGLFQRYFPVKYGQKSIANQGLVHAPKPNRIWSVNMDSSRLCGPGHPLSGFEYSYHKA